MALTSRALVEEEGADSEEPTSREASPTASGLRRSKRNRSGEQEDDESTGQAFGSAGSEHDDQEPGVAIPDDLHGDLGLGGDDSDDLEESKQNDDASSVASSTANRDPNNILPDTSMRDGFQEYCRSCKKDLEPLTSETVTSVKLLDALRRKKAPLVAYQEIMEWHLKETGHLPDDNMGLKHSSTYFTRGTLMRRLVKRYGMQPMMPIERKVKLPHSKSVVSIPIRDAKDCIVSLLTDPRVQAADYLFFEDNPLAPPPTQRDYVEDLNSGDAHRASFEEMIKERGEVLLPVPLYIDGAVTGQFADLPITALKLTLGIWKRETRDHGWAWRELGFVPQVSKARSRGKKIFKESKHLEAQDMIVMAGEGDSVDEDTDSDYEDEDGAVKAQDFHTILDAILESFVELQRTGFMWDLVYKGKVYKNIKFIIFVPFVKCDTEEADTLCAKYLSRNQNVQHICRYCHCPTNKADDPNASYKLKTQKEIERLVEKGDLVRLKAISQHCLQNAWYKVTFHAASNQGIHGACPSEMLHAILLGIFKYERNIFFDHCGQESQLADDINGLAKMYGSLLIHQSDWELPNTNFSRGIRKGKLMAKEYRGVLLVMAAVLRSTEGKRLLKKKKKFGGDNGLRDWTWLTELLLQWEAYLNEKRMKVTDLKRLSTKNWFIMYLMKNVAKRHEGMGLKVSEPLNQIEEQRLQTQCLYLTVFLLDADYEIPCHCSSSGGHPFVWGSFQI